MSRITAAEYIRMRRKGQPVPIDKAPIKAAEEMYKKKVEEENKRGDEKKEVG